MLFRSEAGDPQDAGQGDTGSAPTPVQEITASEAARMFEAVKEGDPRVVIDPGSQGGKDW